MKKVTCKKIILAVLLVSAMLFNTGMFSSANMRVDFAARIPFGAEVELIGGLSEAEGRMIINQHYNIPQTEYEILRNIAFNFRNFVSDNYYSGSYFEGDSRIFDRNGNLMIDARGRPIQNKDALNLVILVTDMGIVPRELKNHPKITFFEVKYSLRDLETFKEKIWDNIIVKSNEKIS